MRAAYDKMQDAVSKIGSVSSVERELVDAIKRLGFSPGKVGRWRCDAVNHQTKVVVEVHGEWWHVRPGSQSEKTIRERYGGVHPRSRKTIEEIWERDSVKKGSVEALGYVYIILWESDVDAWLELLTTLSERR